jgi:hypothetical protein
MPDDPDEDALARDMIEVHGVEASRVARANARTAALAGPLHWRSAGSEFRKSCSDGAPNKLPGNIRQVDIPSGRRVK